MEYALYKDDTFICIGTLKEIAKYLSVTYDTVRSYKSKKKYIFVKLGGDKDEISDNI